jgi:F-box domain
MAEVPQQHAHSLLYLPRDVQLCILALCGTSDLAAVAVACSHLRALARTDELWRAAAEHANAGKPALAELFRAVIADAHWLRRPPSVPCEPETTACPPGAALQATDVAAVQWGNTDGGEWLLTRNGTRLREWQRSCRQAASFVAYLRYTGSHAPVWQASLSPAGLSGDCGCECRPAQHPAAAHGAWCARGVPVAVPRRAANVAGELSRRDSLLDSVKT